MEQILASMGTQIVGFLLLYWYMDKTMKNQREKETNENQSDVEQEKIKAQLKIAELESHKEDFDRLCEKIDKIVDAMHEIVTNNVQRMIIVENEIYNIKDMYIRTANKIADIHEKIIEIRALVNICPNTKIEGGKENVITN